MNAVPIVWRVVVVEDDPDTRQFLESCVKDQTQFALAGSFATLQPALAWFTQHEADLLLVDLGLPDGSGLQLMREVQQRWPQCDMLVVSMFGDEENVVASIEAGAVGYMHKDDEAADIAQTLLAVKQGASPISPMIARHLLRRMQPPTLSGVGQMPKPGGKPELVPGPVNDLVHDPANEQAVSLTKREQEVLEYIARGFSYAEIARL